MIRLLWVLVFFCVTGLAVGQQQGFSITGKIVDLTSKQPLAGASVFCQNTTKGAATNSDGNFSLSLPNGGYDLVVSFTGYETQSLRISNNNEQRHFVIELKQQEKNMDAVVIQASNEVPDGLAKYGQFFLDNFIGRSLNAAQCTLQNPEALRFFFVKRKNKLRVMAKEDLIIKNKALGYSIRYQLDSFIHEYNTEQSYYTGYPFFEEMAGSPEEKAIWKENRERAYNGSILHFMRSYYDSTLTEEGFLVQVYEKGENAKPTLITDPYQAKFYGITEDDTELRFAHPFQVIYKNERPERRYIEVNKYRSDAAQSTVLRLLNGRSLFIEENGYYYEQSDISINGYWTWELIADLLPYDYFE